MRAKDIMTKNLISVSKNCTVKEASIKMTDADVGCVTVNDDNHVVGIITDRDVVTRGVAKYNNIDGLECESIMTKDVVTADADSDMEDVIELMSDYQIKRVPITDGNTVVGMVSLRDISQSIQWEDDAAEVLHDITKPDLHTTF